MYRICGLNLILLQVPWQIYYYHYKFSRCYILQNSSCSGWNQGDGTGTQSGT